MQNHPTENSTPQWRIILKHVWEHFGGIITDIEHLEEAQLISKIKNLLLAQPSKTISYFILQTLPIESAAILLEFDYFFVEKHHRVLLKHHELRKQNLDMYPAPVAEKLEKTKTATIEIANPSAFIRLLLKYELPTVGNYEEQTEKLRAKVEAEFNTPDYLESLLKDKSKIGVLDEFYLAVHLYTNWNQSQIKKVNIDEFIQHLITFRKNSNL